LTTLDQPRNSAGKFFFMKKTVDERANKKIIFLN
jgi:hypothetical protein